MGKSTEPLKTRQYVTAETLTNFFGTGQLDFALFIFVHQRGRETST